MVPILDESMSASAAIGGRIRALRQRLKLTLDEVAVMAGISKPFLSQVERGRATPSLQSLVGIARALGVSMQYFVEAPTEAKSVRRAETLQFFSFTDSANSFARLTNQMDSRQLDAVLVKMPVDHAQSAVASNTGEQFLYVIRGEIALTLDGRTFTLKQGDTAHYEANVTHAWRNVAAEESWMVWVGTPRLF
ncbi:MULTISPECIES: XRE family transcriptional regulator [unclassified Burkholderia]|uniref:helix-turn-helix domain-containing protein n=1 Tax=unclassified Burkholderia TaxID=2613784 RepID=UPI0004697FF7|nr:MULTISPECIES: XRE family transcriptional regulator [unclassified Burkholderia]NIE86058.1 helix-turn-helix transcriptional regulator [Burkholderia sp. Tr-860]NIF63860.1 helix-turn-helix transcriptional regulator [Burkholderia sp. Cy-647]NIF72622.1 helix-turn-helix transcriptional regulator [Burkholderia sp. Ap-962]NIF91637.1 helix-turn-helix transcriptional regulator [Burkholderia sp. Cy-637]NIF98666.1 helix-turn-helix transcriptional regulator [Burkholderia sp. Ax-1720]